MLKKILIALAVIIILLVISWPAANRVSRRAQRHHLRPRAGGICSSERFPQMGGMESLGENRSGDEANLRGCAGWNRCHLHVGRQ